MKMLVPISIAVLLTLPIAAQLQEKDRQNSGNPPPRLSLSSMDENHDGLISMAEFSSFAPPRKNAETIFNRLDTDNDGFVSEAELQSMRKPKRPCFSSLDTDSNGSVSFDEFSNHEIPFGDHSTVFNMIDTDGNSLISEAEFTNHQPPHRHKNKRR